MNRLGGGKRPGGPKARLQADAPFNKKLLRTKESVSGKETGQEGPGAAIEGCAGNNLNPSEISQINLPSKSVSPKKTREGKG